MISLANAGGNPDVKGFIDFDPPNRVHEISAEPYTTVNAYICFGDLDVGLLGACFRINDVLAECPGVVASAGFTNTVGGFTVGDVFEGIVVTALDCQGPPDANLGYLEIFYLGGECCVQLLDHPEYPRWAMDCGNPVEEDYYCVLSHGSIGGAACPDGDCGSTPVENSTWGTIKSLYR
jgi:hypothetical protein